MRVSSRDITLCDYALIGRRRLLDHDAPPPKCGVPSVAFWIFEFWNGDHVIYGRCEEHFAVGHFAAGPRGASGSGTGRRLSGHAEAVVLEVMSS